MLLASSSVPAELRSKITQVAQSTPAALAATSMIPIGPDSLVFTLHLMKIGGIYPKTYSW